MIRTPDRGQFSVNISKPGVVKGNHWHHTKNEKFLVVGGRGVIRFRRVDSDKIIEYPVSGDRLEVVDIPPGYTHNIEILGITSKNLMWPANPRPGQDDTFYLEVLMPSLVRPSWHAAESYAFRTDKECDRSFEHILVQPGRTTTRVKRIFFETQASGAGYYPGG
jgi:dTDP-4-dehydrorhamnose 3,5-epimerase-like enzyme